jgi:hypothetical protein
LGIQSKPNCLYLSIVVLLVMTVDIEWLSLQLNIKSIEDWYNVSTSQVLQKAGRGFLDYYGKSLINALTTIYPHYQWEVSLYHCYDT